MDRWEAVRATALVAPPLPPALTAWLAFTAALLVVVLPSAWRRMRVALTVAHEGAHAIVGVLSGRRLAGIRLHTDSSGLTLSRGRPRGPGMVATAAAGYPGPSLLGLGAALLVSHGHAVAAAWLAALLLAVLLTWTRNGYGLLAVGGVLCLVVAVSWWATPAWLVLAVSFALWFLLLGAPRAVLELAAARRRGHARGSDADVLARLTHLPAVLWIGLFLAADLAAVLLAAHWLLPVPGG